MLMSTLSPFEPPKTRPFKDPSERFSAGPALLFLLKCLVFALIFCGVWFLAMRPPASPGNASAPGQDALLQQYREQVRAADELQARYQRQTEDLNKVLARQEELLQRLDAATRRLESQAGARK